MRRLSYVRAVLLFLIVACGHPESPVGQEREPGPLSVKQQLLSSDADGDGVADSNDNCPNVANPQQQNANGIGPGDACELSLTWSCGVLTDFARFQSHKELVTLFAPLTLTGCPDLLRVSAPAPALAVAHLSPLTQRLGVRSLLDLLPGYYDMIGGSEVLEISIGQDPVLGGAKASNVWLRLDGSATVSVTFFSGSTNLGSNTASTQGTNWKKFTPSSGSLFDRIQLRATSGRFGLRGPGDGVLFTLGSGQLPCPSGYERVGGTCADINECAGLERVCDPLTTCANADGSFSCGACPAGYRGTGATSCVEIDECAEGTAQCSPLVSCSNTPGSYHCGACPNGYRGDGRTCTDIDECAEATDTCDPLVTCSNRAGSYDCGSCPSGYAGGGQTGCHDIDECTGPNRACDALTTCSNQPGSFICGECPAGYRGTGATSCVDIDECAEHTATCSPLATCANTTGGFQCGACPAGYRGDGHACSDVDECAEHSAQCSELATCENVIGSYRCGPCPSGYVGDGTSCVDRDECESHPCDPRTPCENAPGSYHCAACPPGFAGNGYTGCLDVDECAAGTATCSPLVTCGNTVGGYTCSDCPAGYSGDGHTCTDQDECGLNLDQCDPLVTCTNAIGTYTCGPCPTGYSGDGFHCVDLDECMSVPCDPLTTCANTAGAYSCSPCPSGYVGDGYAGCADIDECAVSNGGCPATEACENTVGSHRCVACPPGSTGVAVTCGVGACAATGATECDHGQVRERCLPGVAGLSDVTCDNVDDDCDGQTDEDYAAVVITCSANGCVRPGEIRCVGGHETEVCDGAPVTADDHTCDGVDDDCDGSADEDFVPQEVSCGIGVCTSTVMSHCDNGVEVDDCVPGDPQSTLDDSCDDLDQDCDGSMNEDYVGYSTFCGEGACQSTGSSVCEDRGNGYVVADNCEPLPSNPDTNCDGVDDDCDGNRDEDFEGDEVICGLGACGYTSRPRCVEGSIVDACEAVDHPESDTTCDGIDEDCDGETDEDFGEQSSSCGVGICRAGGIVTCIEGLIQDTCAPGTGNPGQHGTEGEGYIATPFDNVCNGADDDCDGDTDEEYVDFAILCGVGACERLGTAACIAGQLTPVCQPGLPLTGFDITCDGIDDDCDGQTDEDFTPQVTECGVGACRATGVASCISGRIANTCEPLLRTTSRDRLCNGVDDDCDGFVDDDYVGTQVACGAGSCAQTGTTVCMAGTEATSCQPGAPAANDATCDGRDDDCDGSVDEDVQVEAIACGAGACASTGTRRCSGGTLIEECVTGLPSGMDTDCDGIDDDCDGVADDEYRGISIVCETGGCSGLGAIVCREGEEISNCELAPSCSQEQDCSDAVDNDADGQLDCADADCSHDARCFEDCSDGDDNDGDGDVDCGDDACAGRAPCMAEACSNDLDDDGDGRSDCLDSECTGQPNCTAVPPDPTASASPSHVDPEPTLLQSYGFLLEGSEPFQHEVTAPLSFNNVSLVVFHVRDQQGAPLGGVKVSVPGRPDIGYSFTRADGDGELLVEGGNRVAVQFSAPGMLTAYRSVTVGWGRVRVTTDVVLLPPSGRATALRLDGTSPSQIALGDVTNDDRGRRQAALYMPAGVRAHMVMPDGTTGPLPAGRVRITEYTRGELGAYSMPAQLPENTAYTYAFEAEFDEARAAGATRVEFDQPVSMYVNNFLDVPTGLSVPLGYFDPGCLCWVPEDDARVIKILALSIQGALLDTNGDGIVEDAASLAAQGISADERRRLAQLYAPGKSFWRMRMTHFSTWDCNLNQAPPDDAEPPPDARPPGETDDTVINDEECKRGGSVIGCTSQSLGETIPLAGTPYALTYSSLRARKRYPSSFTLPITGATVPASLLRVRVQKLVAGAVEQRVLPPTPNQSFEVKWNGLDRFNRLQDGIQPVDVRVCYAYLPVILATREESGRTFAAVRDRLAGNGFNLDNVPNPPAGAEFELCREHHVVLQPSLTASTAGVPNPDRLSAWQIDAVPQVSAAGQTLLQGVDAVNTGANSIVNRVPFFNQTSSTSRDEHGNSSWEGGLLWVLPDATTVVSNFAGAFYGAETRNRPDIAYRYNFYSFGPGESLTLTQQNRYATDTEGRITFCLSKFSASPDCFAATQDELGFISQIAFSSDGREVYLYSGRTMSMLRFQVRRSTYPTGRSRMEFVQGTYMIGGPAYVPLASYPPSGLSTYHANASALNFYSNRGDNADTGARFQPIVPLTDGSVLIEGMPLDVARGVRVGQIGVWRLRPNGVLERVYEGVQQVVAGPNGGFFAITFPGSGYRLDRRRALVTFVSANGRVQTVYTGDEQANTDCKWCDEDFLYDSVNDRVIVRRDEFHPWGLRTGRVMYQSIDYKSIMGRYFPPVPQDFTLTAPVLHLTKVGDDPKEEPRPHVGRSNTFFVLPNGTLRFENKFFDPTQPLFDLVAETPGVATTVSNRVLAAENPRTREVLRTFDYDTSGRMSAIVERNGQRTTLERRSDGLLSAVVGPFGHRTEINYDTAKRVQSVTNPMGERYACTYHNDSQLLATFTDPEDATSKFEFDENGRLTRDEDALGGAQTLVSAWAQSYGAQGVTITDADAVTSKYFFRSPPDQMSVEAPGELLATRTTERGFSRVTQTSDGRKVTEFLRPDELTGTRDPVPMRTVVRRRDFSTTEFSQWSWITGSPKAPLGRGDEIDLGPIPYTPPLTSGPVVPFWRRYRNLTTRTETGTNAMARRYEIQFDARGLPLDIRASGVAQTFFSWDAVGRLESATRAERSVSFTYGTQGKPQTMTAPDGVVTTFAHDPAGRLLSTTTGGATTGLRYDRVGRVVAVTTPAGIEHSFVRSAKGQVTDYLADGVQELHYSYTPAGRIASIQYGDGSIAEWSRIYTYGASSTTVKLHGSSGGVAEQLQVLEAPGQYLEAKGLGAPVKWALNSDLVAEQIVPKHTVKYVYDKYDWPRGILLDGVGHQIDNRDLEGALKSVDVGNTNGAAIGSVSLIRDPSRNLRKTIMKQIITKQVLNAHREVTSYAAFYGVPDVYGSYDAFGDYTGTERDTITAELYEVRSIVRDGAGRVLHEEEEVEGEAASHDYEYDDQGRLTDVHIDGTPARHYDYDANGNRLARVSTQGTESGSYNRRDQLLAYGTNEYEYDGSGRLARITDTATGLDTELDYHKWGWLRSVHLPDGRTIAYQNDSLGRRTAKLVGGQVQARWLYVDGLRLLAEMNASEQLVSRFVYADRANVPSAMVNGNVLYRIVSDLRGSVRLVVNAQTGAIAQRLDYDEFGRVLNDTNPGFQPFGFAGGLYDADTGLVRFGARDYDAFTGRWTGSDPIGFAGGSANLYAYTANDPVNRIDPNGKFWFVFGAAALVAGYAVWNDLADIRDRSAADAYNDPRIPAPNGALDDAADAYRHCLASCRVASSYGGDVALAIGNLREALGENTPAQKNMDMNNNICGSSMPGDDCVSECRGALEGGVLTTLTPAHQGLDIYGLFQ